MKWNRYSPIQAEKFISLKNLETYVPKDFDFTNKEEVDFFNELQDIFEKHKHFIENEKNKEQYLFDMYFGLDFYNLVNKYGMTNYDAASDNVWIFMSIRMMFNVMKIRWSSEKAIIDRSYKDKRRIYPKSLYWFIHLCYQGDDVSTIEVIKNLTTDEIVGLTERTGEGYRIELMRKIVKKASQIEKKRVDFRMILKMNHARTQVIEPDFYKGGCEGYVEDLFKSIYND